MIAKGRARPSAGNKTEQAYGKLLALRQSAGEVSWWRFEGITLKLADDTRYTPDFSLMLANGDMEFHETKGFMRDDARVKLRVAAAQFPFRFWLVELTKGVWKWTEI